MRSAYLLLLVAALLLAGCVSEAPKPASQLSAISNVSPPKSVPANPAIQNASAAGNMSANITVSANITISANVTINATVNVTATQNNQTQNNLNEKQTGIPFGEGRYLLVFEDVTVPDGKECALMSIAYASNHSEITKLDVCPGESQNWIDPGGRVFRIEVLKTAAGYSGSAGWAQVEIFG